MKFRTALTAMAATGLVIAPIAAQAGTRASSSSAVSLAQGNSGGNGNGNGSDHDHSDGADHGHTHGDGIDHGHSHGKLAKGVQEASLKRKGFGSLPTGIWVPLLAGAGIIGFILIDDEGNVTRSPGAN